MGSSYDFDGARVRAGSGGRHTARPSEPELTPAQRDLETVRSFQHAVAHVEHAACQLADAKTANDPEAWAIARDRLTDATIRAQRTQETARGATDGPARERFASHQTALAELLSRDLGTAPTGIASVAGEDRILAALALESDGGAAVAFARKEAAFHAELAGLSAAERRVLAKRLRRPRPADRIATMFHQFIPERRARLLDALESARPITPTLTPTGVAAPEERTAVEEVHVAIDGALASEASEGALFDLLAQLDRHQRRELAQRITRYRPGSGDALGARFMRLEHAVRTRLVQYLETTAPTPGRLPSSLRQRLESHAGVDLSDVRVHTSGASHASAAAVGARAYAVGQDIHFGEGAFDPSSEAGQHLIAHEVAHTIQQRGATATRQNKLAVTVQGDSAETEADRFADAFSGGTGPVALTPHAAAIARDAKPTTPAPELPSGVPFAIEPSGWEVRIRRSWLAASPVERMTEVLQQMQRLGAFTWAKPADLRRAAAKTDFTATDEPIIDYVVNLHTLAEMGLPPLAGTMVGRKGDSLLVEARVPGVKEGDKRQALALTDLPMVEAAITKFTGLAVVHHARFEGDAVRDGIVEIEITDVQAGQIFGDRSWAAWKQTPGTSSGGDATAETAKVTTSELSFSERARVESWLKDKFAVSEIGGVTHMDRMLLDVIDELDADPKLVPIIKQLVTTKTTKPGQVVGVFLLRDLRDAARAELTRQRLGLGGPSETARLDPATQAWSIGGKIVQKGLVFADRAMDFGVEFDWDRWKLGRSAAEIDQLARRDWYAEVDWAVERTDKPGKVHTARQTGVTSPNMKLSHTFELAKGEPRGVFAVHAFVRSSVFVPLHFTAPIEVATERARMDELQEAAMGDMTGAETLKMNTRFDVSVAQKVLDPTPIGRDADTHGYTISGPLPKDWKRSDAGQRSQERRDAIELQRKLGSYLRKQIAGGSPGYADAALAAERRVTFLEDTETKLAADTAQGWLPFELRGTYLSRGEDVPSGGLDLYGAYKTFRFNGSTMFSVKVRDLSNKLESDLEFEGAGLHFDAALSEAFVKLAKQYPKGTLSVLAEDFVLDKSMQVVPNGRSIGYELATTSAWKRVRSAVFEPAVQILTAAAAMAVTIVFPPSAAVVVPTLVVMDIVRNVDELVDKRDKGKLTWGNASINLSQIGLDILPFARSAKLLDPARTAVQEAKGMVNPRLVVFDAVQLGGQVLVMHAQTRDQLVQIQEKQIATMAHRFAALIELEKQGLNPSDPRIAQRRAEIEQDARAIRNTIVTTWANAVAHQATFFVGAQLLGGHTEAAQGHAANRDTHLAKTEPREPQLPQSKTKQPATRDDRDTEPRGDSSSSAGTSQHRPDSPAKKPVDETQTRSVLESGARPDGRLERLALQLPAELRADVPIRENNAIDGAGVQVVFRDGEFRIEVGPTAEPRHVKYHVDAARHLLKFQGPLGYIRRLISKIIAKLTGTPGYGTAGFEARLEIKKLRAIQVEVEAFKARLVERADAVSRGERVDVDRELANIQEQLEYHAHRVDSFEPGRGFVAARGLPEYPIKKSTIEPREIGTDPRQLEVDYVGKTIDGRKVSFGTATMELSPDGVPADAPSLFLNNYVAHHGVDHSMSIYDDVSPSPLAGGVPQARGDRTPITTHILKEFERFYERRFKRPLKAWEGTLAFENKLNFWREFFRLREAGTPEREAHVAAAKAISFGKHRIALGFTKFKVTLDDKETKPVDLGGALGVRELPQVNILAEKP